VWLREGGVNKRKVSDDPDSKTWWSVAPTPLVAGKTATLLYNSKAGPLAWIEDKRPKGKIVSSEWLFEGGEEGCRQVEQQQQQGAFLIQEGGVHSCKCCSSRCVLNAAVWDVAAADTTLSLSVWSCSVT
jgi:hypothetical protein